MNREPVNLRLSVKQSLQSRHILPPIHLYFTISQFSQFTLIFNWKPIFTPQLNDSYQTEFFFKLSTAPHKQLSRQS